MWRLKRGHWPQRRGHPGCSVAVTQGRLLTLSDKLSILVRVDLDHAKAQVLAKGHVTIHSIQAIYVVVKRANALRHNLVLELDMRHARVDPEALRQLETCSAAHHLPARIDPQQTPCALSILPPRHAVHAAHHTPTGVAA
jgi:hypothetical protein